MGAGNTSKLRWFLSIHAIVVAPKINLQTTWLKIHSLSGLLFRQPVTRRGTIGTVPGSMAPRAVRITQPVRRPNR
ncbi:hypothetical protein Q31a_30170 [Aureliella helgolandensis]|uniref:Uncharacterized protein n=1 Tax=Aureliella helgolandensis TaxID=2527968 RepID=A0A518G7X4_9BACT|nr:hypothetical protein Q31a_30170 [Aureliella helgolandensis]